MAHLSMTLDINAPIATIDAIVGDPQSMSRFWVGMSEPDRVFGDGGPGTKIEFTQLMMGVRMRMTSRTVEARHDPDGSTFWRWEFEGTTSGWITCHHVPAGDGCQITTDFDYSLPGSVFGKAADRLLVEKRTRRDFEDSLENLKLLAEAQAKKTT
jgi:coenzyme Q-binding protein COQ10